MTPALLADMIRARSEGRARFIVALAGPPGAGKSTLSSDLIRQVPASRVVPMDGFHYDDTVLNARGLRSRKGAPETFDVHGFIALMARLRDGGEIAIPVFDRSMELSRAAADVVTDADQVLIVEGNWLLLREAPWDRLAPFFDLTVWIDVPEAELDRRLVARWAHHGKTPQAARDWIDRNDMPNIRRCIAGSRVADVVLQP
jgi:pantothenate kinase